MYVINWLSVTDNNKLKEVETLTRRIYMLRIIEISRFGLHEYLKKMVEL